MNIMDRETILRILKDNSFGTMNMDDVIKVVTSFIIDSGRTEKQDARERLKLRLSIR